MSHIHGPIVRTPDSQDDGKDRLYADNVRLVRAARPFPGRLLRLTSLAEMPLECRQRLRADVVFDAFSIILSCVLRDAQRLQELQHNLMSPAGVLRQLRASGCQENRAIRLRRDVTVPLQAGDRADDRYVRNAEPPCQVHRSRLPGGGGEIGDGLHVIPRRLGRMLAAGLPQGGGLRCRGVGCRWSADPGRGSCRSRSHMLRSRYRDSV